MGRSHDRAPRTKGSAAAEDEGSAPKRLLGVVEKFKAGLGGHLLLGGMPDHVQHVQHQILVLHEEHAEQSPRQPSVPSVNTFAGLTAHAAGLKTNLVDQMLRADTADAKQLGVANATVVAQEA